MGRELKDHRAMGGVAKSAVAFFSLLLPWVLRRRLLELAFGYKIHATSRIGFSWAFPRHSLVLERNARIGHFNVCRGIDTLHLSAESVIGHLNWITSYPHDLATSMVGGEARTPELILGEHASITHRHYLDCTDCISIGPFTSIVGYRSLALTHSVDIESGRQTCAPIKIGRYCLVGTNCVLLMGASLPDFAVVSAMSLVNTALPRSHRLYGGVPAVELKEYREDEAYFRRQTGRVT